MDNDLNFPDRCKILILGAGIGGLATAAELKRRKQNDFLVVDSADSLPLNLHNGVHYLHSNDLQLPFPFDLKEINSTEEIWNPRKDEFKKQAHLPEMIDYSLKVMQLRHPSSVSDPGNREWKTYLPLSNNMNDLLRAFYNYICRNMANHFCFGCRLVKLNVQAKIATFSFTGALFEIKYEHIVSTIPLPMLEKIAGLNLQATFVSRPIFITNYLTTGIVPNWLISLYISDEKFPPYRITVLNNIISMESLSELSTYDEHIVKYHLERYFDYVMSTVQKSKWDTGRIWGLDKPTRQRIVDEMQGYDIHLLGRFGLWDGKILLDGTIKDAKWIVNDLKL